ncbi:uncharacterized protein H6S33_002101 [Morchella sextelata]|uniref:uncharacterized protein n=1 Tax=Morchella sextelata TaxID=1174677 RepID=UPI001D04CF9A|nr:uncharacterized protein H6S33_002101 [Morchella sextelata]KAH0608049.1 hypothetical protein H6S33_002101 [Morchella sextelata]
MQLLRVWSLAAALLSTAAYAKGPEVNSKEFDNIPAIFFYFDDSSVILTLDAKAGNIWRSDNDGKKWQKVQDIPEGDAWDLIEHPFDKKRAFILGQDTEHWYTKNQGKSWQKFKAKYPASYTQPAFSFHAEKPNLILYAGRICEDDDFFGLNCKEVTYYTKDGFDSDMKQLRDDTHSCIFARGTEIFSEAKDYTIVCIVNGKDSFAEHRKLVVSDNFFDTEVEPKLNGYSTVDGLAGIAGVQKFIVAAVKSKGTDEMALYVTDDTINWDRAEFPHDHGGLKEDAYTILESTPYSIQVDVLTTKPMNPMGSLFTSNSNGTYFTKNLEYTNRAPEGYVDFEQVQNIQGIILANVVDNADEVAKSNSAQKKVISRISFDDGKFDTWKPLKTKDGDDLHLFSVTALANGGRIFSSPAPGILMGVGNTGKYLESYTDCDLYLSDDAGLTWNRVRKEAHKYEFGGSGSIIVAINDEEMTDEVFYSINHGDDWDSVKLDEKVRARLLTTTPDSTSLFFTLIGTNRDRKTIAFSIDFSNVFDRKCKSDKSDKNDDLEKWYARLDEDGEPDCLMGHKQFFWRRKKNAKCYIDDLYKDPEPQEDVCKCTEEDFECDFNYVRENGKRKDKCVKAKGAKFPTPSGECKKPEDTFMGSSGYRKIPGNDCEGGKDLDKKVETSCKDAATAPPSNGDIVNRKKSFPGSQVAEYYYLEKSDSSSNQDETIIMRTEKQEIWLTHDHGEKWERILKDVEVVSIYPNTYFYDSVYFITPDAEVWYTQDRGRNFKKMDKVPSKPNRRNLQVMDFHPTKKNWLIWTGQADCDKSETCHAVAYYTKDNGFEWHELLEYVGACKWVRGEKQKVQSEKLIFCQHDAKENGSGNIELVASDNFFDDEKKHFDDIIGYATIAEFIVVASINEDETSLKASASVDGYNFAEAKFPHNFNVPHQTAYTVLDSNTHSVFLHVTVNPKKGFEYGSLLKSNFNGTNYVLSLDAVNRNELGFVDFEKMHSLEGVAIANRVTNAEKALDGEKKKLESLITHNDGATWEYIQVEGKDSENKDYSCNPKNVDDCHLNLHHYTERTDPRDTFASGSAVGLMLGVGNVGRELTGYRDGDTFMTRDGGITWKEVRKGQHMWEYGDQGSIIVIVDVMAATDRVVYTLDEGENWHEYIFADKDEKVVVKDISTLPTDTSRKFILWGRQEGGGDEFLTIQLDFTGITDVQCELKEGDEANSDDFEVWSPKHPAGLPGCLFGRVTDDFNYERQNDGTCGLVKGYSPPDHKAICTQDKNAIEYFEPTGYRRIPYSTCEGGHELEKTTPKPCPGHEQDFEKKRGRGAKGFMLFLAVVTPIAAAFGIGWFVWTKILDGRFGAIRLGEDSSGQSPFIRYPIIVIAALVAVVVSIPTILQAIGTWVGGKFTRTRRYTSRQSFARGADYSIVNNDEGELLGSDDDDEL